MRHPNQSSGSFKPSASLKSSDCIPTGQVFDTFNPISGNGISAKIPTAIDSTAKGEIVARRRFQKGSVFQNQSKTVWLGAFSEYVLDSNGVEKRKRKTIVLGPIRKSDGEDMRKREAQRLLQPYLDRVNSSISAPSREHNSAVFDGFADIWERDYMGLSKPSPWWRESTTGICGRVI